jgi:hypothetical protein
MVAPAVADDGDVHGPRRGRVHCDSVTRAHAVERRHAKEAGGSQQPAALKMLRVWGPSS